MGKVPGICYKTQEFVAPASLFPGIPYFVRYILEIVHVNELLARVYIVEKIYCGCSCKDKIDRQGSEEMVHLTTR